jgi:asparagine synthase (glutamine-hydrolysing)
MCGIAGIVLAPGSTRRLDAPLVERMRDTLVHRGPDDAGLYLDGRCGLGHRRLSIVDVAHGHQPMSSDDGSLHLVYNGEVYNHAALRSELEARGHRYRTRCDTETVLRLYAQEGAAGVFRLRGMFAFAVWDARRGELFLARDRLGIKPLYYVHAADGSLYFASEIKALLEAGAVRPELNAAALPDYLANHAPSGEETLFAGVRRLPPAHTLRWREGRIELRRYWQAPDGPADDGAPDEVLVRRFADAFEDAVRARLMADVPLGVFLSGGIDSAAIAATMARMVRAPVRTFSVAFAEAEANELGYARMVAQAYGTEHHEVVVPPEAFFALLPRLVWHEDEPLAHPSSVPLYFVSELAARHVKVVLTGEGSDELLGGYGRYRKALLNLRLGDGWSRVPAAVRDAVRRGVAALPTSPLRARLERTFLCNPPGVESLYFDAFAVFSRGRQAALLTPAMRERTGGADPYAAHLALHAASGAPPLGRLLAADAGTYLHELLMKQDQMSMAASIESRVPFLDHPLVELAGALPERMKLRGAATKYVLRRAMHGVLPPAVLSRRKMGFPVPFGRWVRGRFRPLLDDLVLGPRALERGIFDPAGLRRLVAEHAAGTADHAERLWSLVNLELWHRRFLDGEAPAAPVATPAPEPALAEAR